MTNKILEVKNIRKNFKNIEILKDINLEISSTDIASVFGYSGEGKSTLLKIICGLVKPDFGNVILENNDISRFETNQRHISLVMDEPLLFPNMNVFQNISFGLKLSNNKRKLSSKQIHKLTMEIMHFLGIDGLEDRYPNEISMGQSQRVSIARALVIEPKIVLMDEPFSNLDLISKTKVKKLIKKIHKELNIPILLVTHDLDDVMSLADIMFVLNKGKIQISGSPTEVLKTPDSLDLAFLLGTENIYKGIMVANDKEKNSSLIRLSGHKETLIEAVYKMNINVGQELFLAIRPEDIIILRDNKKTSIRENIISGTIISLISTYRMIELLVILDNDLECKILVPPHAFQIMNLYVGKIIWLSFKKNAINIINKK